MDVSKLIDQITLNLLVNTSIDAELCPTLVALLEIRAEDPETKAFARQLEKLVRSGVQTGTKEHEQCLNLLEELSFRIKGRKLSAHISGATGECVKDIGDELLAYDVSHGSAILDSFFSEVSAHLQLVEEKLLKLETDFKCTEALNAVFGAMHSLKGIMGFLDLKCAHLLAHEAEAVMEHARNGDRGIELIECDAILRTVDAMREIQHLLMVHSRQSAQPFPKIPESCKALLAELRVLSSQESHNEPFAISQFSIPLEPATKILHPESAVKPQHIETSSSIRVKIQKLDVLMEAIGELVVVQAQVSQDPSVRRLDSQRLMQNLSQFGKITRDLQAIAMALRMYPLRELFGRVTRLARDLAHKQKKEVEVIVTGDETELDKNVIEALVDPLTHLIRNAIDHGVDSPEARATAGKPPRAKLTISARHQSGNVIVTISDDGRGLNLDRICARAKERGLLRDGERPNEIALRNMIFEPGFSTAERVTELSGRGVGLDVVRRNIQALGGHVSVDSVPGQSTSFALSLPLTLAIIDGLIIRTGSERFIVPITSIVESVRPVRQQINTIQERGEVIDVRGTLLPMLRLAEFAGIEHEKRDVCESIVMIVECGSERCGLVVDEILGQQQVVIRSLGEHLKNVRGIASGAILGDGKVGLILDVPQILQASRETELQPVLN